MERMPRHPVPLGPFVPAAPHGVLKSLLEKPMKLPLHHEAFSKEQEKEKNLVEERSVPHSAFLGPTLWDKTLPYDGDSFQLEYMDLEEFLSENGISSNASQHHHSHHHHSQHQPHAPPRQSAVMSQAPPTPTPSVMDLSNHASTSKHTSVASLNCLHSSSARAGADKAECHQRRSEGKFIGRKYQDQGWILEEPRQKHQTSLRL